MMHENIRTHINKRDKHTCQKQESAVRAPADRVSVCTAELENRLSLYIRRPRQKAAKELHQALLADPGSNNPLMTDEFDVPTNGSPIAKVLRWLNVPPRDYLLRQGLWVIVRPDIFPPIPL